MDKTAIRNFAIEARKILMKSAITEAGFYGITKDGCKDPVQKGNDFEVYETVAGTENRIFGDDIKRRANLVTAIKEQGFDQVIEETAYTWFNRIIAIRFMEVNNYLPTRVRVLSSETGSTTPDIVTQSDTVELNLSTDELERIQTAKRENRYDDAFRSLFIKQCNELNAILPGLFEKTDDYMELLLKITYTGDGVIRMLVDSIPEDNFNVETEGQVEIIGWMYQYYNTELKDDTFAKLKKNVKITKERIPAATQLFTPDWIVRYMVENSLGRVWIEHLRAVNSSVDEKAKAEEFGWKYYLPEAEQEDGVQAQLVEIRKSYKDLTPQDITCIDPCMGSGHILVYMFDVLMDIYRSEGFSEREAVFDILEKNIRGLDIDRRAYQLSYFALMMKARGYNRIFFRGHEDIDGNRVLAFPVVYAIEESNSVDRTQLKYFGAGLDELSRNNAINQMSGLLDSLINAKEYGSIIKIENYDWKLLHSFIENIEEEGQSSLFGYAAYQSQTFLKRLIDIGAIISEKYYAVITNPPYMNANGMNPGLSGFIKKNYPNTKSDLSTVFMEKAFALCRNSGYMAMINIPVWMFITSYANLRSEIIQRKSFVNMLHLGRGVFGSDFGTTAFVIQNKEIRHKASRFYKLYLRQGEVDSVEEKEKMFFERVGEYVSTQDSFDVIPESPIAYWASSALLSDFEKGTLVAEYASPKQGMSTCDVNRFTKLWFEVAVSDTNLFDGKNIKKWVRYNKGGSYRKWYGNREYMVYWGEDGSELINNGALLRNRDAYFKPFFAWTKISSAGTGFRFFEEDFLFDGAGGSLFSKNNGLDNHYLLGLLNSKVNTLILNLISPTLNFNENHIGSIPVLVSDDEKVVKRIDYLVEEAISISKEDWDEFEFSWNFKEHPLVRLSRDLWDVTSVAASMDYYYGQKVEVSCPLELCYMLWQGECNERFKRLKEDEEELNRLFIDIYGLNNELTPEVDEKDITLRRADLSRDIRSLISYAVGCIFGRYSLSEQGLIFAGGDFDSSKYSFPVDEDAIIPVTDEVYFDDDIVGRLEHFIATVFGVDCLEENLEYMAKALGNKGNTSREVLRNYFIDDFYTDHCNSYSTTGSGKRPIYWMFNSGKENGFKCLTYLHRYTVDTVGRIRSDYLAKTQTMIENALKNAEYAINSSASAVDKAQATKKRDKYIKQLAEIRAYYPALSHIALQRIELNLDDGVKANYEKFQGIEVSIEGEKKQKVNLLAKI